ncbi:hypothetical protein [Actinomadura hibisca]|uniref:hypothetical protein n=1 Tax=Actinomadura hibisca TaxID=68565 RepID=UPI000834D6C9|nr:hypothetical protein [Actinomadura hibisca]
MKKLLRTAAVGAGIATVGLTFAQPALANTFNKAVGDGTVSYNDTTDQFCAQAYNTEGLRSITVKLTPISQSGPSHNWTDKNSNYASGGTSGATCRSLSSAYEDTQYRAEIWSYWGERGTTISRGTVTFYS